MNLNAQPGALVDEPEQIQEPQKQKRSRFAPERRKEVSIVRSQGACIRCRMLRKPCSGDDPCTTCQSIEGPRLWKESCTRVRLVDQFTLFKLGVHSKLAKAELDHVKEHVQLHVVSTTIETSHFDQPIAMMSLKVLQGCRDPSVPDGVAPRRILAIDSEFDDVPKKIDSYIKEMASMFIDHETSAFVKTSLNLAVELHKAQPDELLWNSIQLWTAAQILANPENKWKILAASHSLTQLVDISIDKATDPQTYTLLCNQLYAATEKRAEQLGKSTMTEIERRFIRKPNLDSTKFETFLTCTILLNCIERICWLFRMWANGLNKEDWPLGDVRPEDLAGQGDDFTDTLHMFMRVRSLQFKAVPSPEDGVLTPVDDGDKWFSKWLGSLKITIETLQKCQAGQFDLNDFRSLDGKYSSRVLTMQLVSRE